MIVTYNHWDWEKVDCELKKYLGKAIITFYSFQKLALKDEGSCVKSWDYCEVWQLVEDSGNEAEKKVEQEQETR